MTFEETGLTMFVISGDDDIAVTVNDGSIGLGEEGCEPGIEIEVNQFLAIVWHLQQGGILPETIDEDTIRRKLFGDKEVKAS